MAIYYDRIEKISTLKGYSSVNSFALEGLGYKSSQKINRLKQENTYPGFQILIDISRKFEDVDINWIIDGEGSPLIIKTDINKQRLSDFDDIEILKYIHKNLDRFKSIPSFKKLFEVAYWQEQVEELERIKANAIKEAKLQSRDNSKIS